MKTFIYLLALCSTSAFATSPPSTPTPAPVSVSQQQAALAAADARAAAAALAGARSDATGGAGGNAAGGAGGLANASGGTANGEVNVGGDTSDFDAKALALGQIRAYAAPAVPGECRVHSRGWDITVASATGGTKFEKECVAEQKCFRIVEIYIRLGRESAALKQLGVCGGLLEVPVEAAPEPKRDYFTREEQIEREKRIIEKMTGK